MQALSPSILRGKPFIAPRHTPRGGGLPLCLSGVSIVTQVCFQRLFEVLLYVTHLRLRAGGNVCRFACNVLSKDLLL